MATVQHPKVRIRSPLCSVIGAAVDAMRKQRRDSGETVSRETPAPPQFITTAGTDENGRTFTRHLAMTNLDSTNDPAAMTG